MFANKKDIENQKIENEILYNQITTNNNDFVMFNYANYDDTTGEKTISGKFLKPFSEVIDNPNIRLYEMDERIITSCFATMLITKAKFIKENNINYNEELRPGEDARCKALSRRYH